MKERPILFSAPMVRAILEDRKTQTRRVVKPQPTALNDPWPDNHSHNCWHDIHAAPDYHGECGNIPFAKGMRLWVRETFFPMPHLNCRAFYRATDPLVGCKWKPSIFMPRTLSRITLEVVGVRVEQLQTISENDAAAEGIDTSVTHPSPTGIPQFKASHYVYASECFADLWRLINGSGSWDTNPWVWVISFRRLKQ